jgi:hypothetical protein
MMTLPLLVLLMEWLDEPQLLLVIPTKADRRWCVAMQAETTSSTYIRCTLSMEENG